VRFSQERQPRDTVGLEVVADQVEQGATTRRAALLIAALTKSSSPSLAQSQA